MSTTQLFKSGLVERPAKTKKRPAPVTETLADSQMTEVLKNKNGKAEFANESTLNALESVKPRSR